MKESGDDERPEKEVEVVWPCDEKRGALFTTVGRRAIRMELGSTGTRRGRTKTQRRWWDSVRDDIKEKALSDDEVYDRAT